LAGFIADLTGEQTVIANLGDRIAIITDFTDLNLSVTTDCDSTLVIAAIQGVIVTIIALLLTDPNHSISASGSLTIGEAEVPLLVIAIVTGFVAVFPGFEIDS
jgi:hypothetical protein